MFYQDPKAPPQDVLIRVIPGQSQEVWREFVRLAFHYPGGLGEIYTETMTPEEAQTFGGYATIGAIKRQNPSNLDQAVMPNLSDDQS